MAKIKNIYVTLHYISPVTLTHLICYINPIDFSSDVIPSSDITSSSNKLEQPSEGARPNSESGGWEPEKNDPWPFLQIDLRSDIPVHGIGTLGHKNNPCTVMAYEVYVCKDGGRCKNYIHDGDWEPLRTTDGSGQPRVS